jgi:DNA/RNA-binding domain of Phe-tRNA-synthetase-like protein
MFTLQNELASYYPGASIGILIMRNVLNIPFHEKLNVVKSELEKSLRTKYGEMSRNQLKSVHPMDIYVAYYKKFGYSYHVLHQLESIIRGKAIPSVSALVEAMFMAELKNMLLTAGHDLERIKLPLHLKVSTGKEHYMGLNGKEMTIIQSDMMISDAEGIISSILRGPDLRTCISPATSQVLFTAYAPPGIHEALVYQHLHDIEMYVHVFADKSTTDLKQAYRI